MQSLAETRMHLEIHAEKPIKRCFVCNVNLIRRELKSHLCRPDVDAIDCDYCFKSFSSVLTLLNHVETDHPERKMFKCLECSKYFPMELLLNYHGTIHTNRKKKHICDICSRAFYEERNLNSHLKRHQMENSK